MAEHLTAEVLSDMGTLRHAFFTRRGGVSTGLYGSLNVGFGSSDEPADVEENRARCMAVLGVAPDRLTTAYQVHGTVAAVVEEPWDPRAAPQADAMVTNRPGIALGILAADCAPVLFADPETGVIGAAHAGWKGALDDIMAATVRAMEALGARRGTIRAAVGPCIAQASYQVGPEFYARFVAASPAHASYFRPSDRKDHHLFDLEAFVCDRLRALDLAGVEALSQDTCVQADRFFSYRRATKNREPDYGRGLSAIALAD